ncbi:hypothetical protein EXIGLDRAFT_461935 [Exidia glandulosa HHB12029]|uniref:Uncharacterized protein n=1 Tax=Exidia glandulosa HHB12029 TaxID=1314781 RepID=A0A165B035_EXIGL|nr:hypothetical protein EXIGLDRAFT_461935 [Exidia glandulosa HHB12029]
MDDADANAPSVPRGQHAQGGLGRSNSTSRVQTQGHVRQRSATMTRTEQPGQPSFYYSASASTSDLPSTRPAVAPAASRVYPRPPQDAAPAQVGLPSHPAQHVRGGSTSHARKMSITPATAQTVLVGHGRQPSQTHDRRPSVAQTFQASSSTQERSAQQTAAPPSSFGSSQQQHHQRNGSLQPTSAVAPAAPSSFKFDQQRPSMARSQSDQQLRQRALLGALGPAAGNGSTPVSAPSPPAPVIQVKASTLTKAERAALAPPPVTVTRSAPTTPPTGNMLNVPPPSATPKSAPSTPAKLTIKASSSTLNTLAAPKSAVEPRSVSGYFDSGSDDEEDALDALKREMMEWRIGVASAWSDGKNDDGQPRESVKLRGKGVPDTPMDLVFATDTEGAKKQRAKLTKKRSQLGMKQVCTLCGNVLDSGECILAHAGYASEASGRPSVGASSSLVRRASDRKPSHVRTESNASSAGASRTVPRRNTLHQRTDSSSTVSMAQALTHGHSHDRRDSLAKLNSALFAAPAVPSKDMQAQFVGNRGVAQHERTMSGMSSMSTMSAASSFFSSDPKEVILTSGRSFASALDRINGGSSLKHAQSTERFPTAPSSAASSLRHATSTDRLPIGPSPLHHATSTERFPGSQSAVPAPVRQTPTDRFAPPLPPPTLRTMPSTERFATPERFAAFRNQYAAGSDSTHNGARYAPASDFSHTTSAYHASSEQSHTSTVVAYASASAESSSSSFPPTPADADWEYAFSSRPNRTPPQPQPQPQVQAQTQTQPPTPSSQPRTPPSRQRSQDPMNRGPALGKATISSTPTASTADLPSAGVPEADYEPRSASRWSEDSTRQVPPRVPSKQASRTNLVRAPSIVSPGADSSDSAMPYTPVESNNNSSSSKSGGFAGALAKRLRLKSLPSSKPKGSGGGGFGLARLGTLVVKNKGSTQEMRSGWVA